MIQQHILRYSRSALGMSQFKTSYPGSIFSSQKRFLNNCLHVKGLPIHLSKDEIFSFFRENYGKVIELASYDEAPSISKSVNNANGPDFYEDSGQYDSTKRRKQFITHNRPPGQTVIIKFESIESAFMCKEELHWRPFPSENYELTEEIVMMEPRDRPLVNILFDTTVLRDRIRGWVLRDLSMSRAWIRQKEKKRRKKVHDEVINKW